MKKKKKTSLLFLMIFHLFFDFCAIFIFILSYHPRTPPAPKHLRKTPPSETPSFGPSPPDTLPRTPAPDTPSAGPPSAGPPKISLCFFLPPQFSFFFLSLGVLSWNGVLEGWGPSNVHVWRHDSQRTPNVQFGEPQHFKHHRNSTKRRPEKAQRV